MFKPVIILAFSLFIVGCFPVVVKKNVQGLSPMERQYDFYLFGTIGSADINMDSECPQGMATLNERSTPQDVLLSVVTFGIYTPRTVYIECRGKALTR